jgi:hypothetical protein
MKCLLVSTKRLMRMELRASREKTKNLGYRRKTLNSISFLASLKWKWDILQQQLLLYIELFFIRSFSLIIFMIICIQLKYYKYINWVHKYINSINYLFKQIQFFYISIRFRLKFSRHMASVWVNLLLRVGKIFIS